MEKKTLLLQTPLRGQRTNNSGRKYQNNTHNSSVRIIQLENGTRHEEMFRLGGDMDGKM